MNYLIVPVLLISLLFTSCEKQAMTIKDTSPSESFFPMEIGNYWKNGDHTYVEIRDTIRFGGHLYYKFHALTGGDVYSTLYMRLDAENQLWEGFINTPAKEYLKARFDAKLNEPFFTLNDQSVNDYQVKLIEKSETRRVFEMDMIYHPNLKGQPHRVTYIKGKGFEGPWESIRISGVVY